jgi:hypothetical protein
MAKIIKKGLKKAQEGTSEKPKKWTGEYLVNPSTKEDRIEAVKTTKKSNGNVKTKRVGYDLTDWMPTESTIQKTVVNSKGDTISNKIKPVNIRRAGRKLGKTGDFKTGGSVKKKMKNGGSLSGLKASNERVGSVDPKGAFTKVQKKTLAGAKGKASLTKDKQLGATKMAKRGVSIKKK